MDKLYRAQLVPRSFKGREAEVQEPLVLDNRSFNLEDGDSKMLDYLNYSGTIAKGSLAADGVIKLCPVCEKEFRRDYGAIANPIKKERPEKIPIETEENCGEFENEWDNIFLNRQDEFPPDKYDL